MLEEFLDAILLDLPEDRHHVFCVLAEPPSDDIPWPPISEQAALRKLRSPNRAAYMSTMVSTTGRNRKKDFAGLWLVVLDDIGTKAEPPSIHPTYRIESSKGNEQWGYVLEKPITDMATAARFVATIYASDHTDGGGNLVNKFVRLPAGINGKLRGDDRNTFPVTLKEFHPERLFTPEQILNGLNLTLVAEAPTAPQSKSLVPRDPVLEWLERNKMVVSPTDSSGWAQITCPWHKEHSEGTDSTAGYSPLGEGDMPEWRGFNCFHDHCKDRDATSLLDWMDGQPYAPNAAEHDPIGYALLRYVFVTHNNEVADITASASTRYPVVGFTNWKNANQVYIKPPKADKATTVADGWTHSYRRIVCTASAFLPGKPPLVEENGQLLYNLYRYRDHPKTSNIALARPYLEHLSWLIPDPKECELFHDWIARKLQQPASRSYAVVLVADVLEGEQGFRYGTGRSTVGDILGMVFQANTANLSLEEVVGKGDSQAVYNDWAEATQLAIVEETKEGPSNWREDNASYEGIKHIIDPRPLPNRRVKPKYGRIKFCTMYTNFLFFTNHSDAFQLPPDDRRLAVLECNKGRRTREEYQELRDMLNDRMAIAAIYYWYLARDISDHDPIYPPMTPAKQRMVAQAENSMDELWVSALEILPGDIVTKKQLIAAALVAADGDSDMELKAPAMIRQRWRKLPRVDTLNERQQVSVKGKPYVVRAIRNTDALAKAVAEEGPKAIAHHLEKNQSAVVML